MKNRGLRCWLSICLFLISGAVTATQYLDESWVALSLPDLMSPQSIAISDYSGKVVLASFFEPDCSWCHRQMKAFNRLVESCDHIQPVAIGINGNRKQLRGELRRAKVQFPGLMADRKFLQSVGDVPATPWTLIVSPEGEPLTVLRGYYGLERLAPALACDQALSVAQS